MNQRASALDLSAEKIDLKFRQFVARTSVAKELAFLGQGVLDVQEEAFHSLLFQLRAAVLTEELPPETFTATGHVTFEVPASTWQMWKMRHATCWYARRLVARWPVRYEEDPGGRGADLACTASLDRWRTYPYSRVLQDHFGAPVHAHTIRDIRWDPQHITPEV